jgi:signal transduction histidine kinase
MHSAIPKKLLIVDDMPLNIRELLHFLTAQAFQIFIAENGYSALKIAQEQQPDLILLDVIMPGMDGFETCEALKTDPLTKHIPVILMTALSNNLNKLKGFQVGAVDYVVKPLQKEEVLARIHTHLTLSHLQKQLESQNQRLKALDAEKNQFLMIASQDLKNTLATLLGVAQFLSKNYQAIDSAGLLDFLNMLELSSGQMLQLICNILDVNKIESNCLNYTLEKVDILPLLFMLVESYAEIARIKHIDLITNIRMDQEFSPIYVNADRTLLQQIFENLLSNAVKFTPHHENIFISIRDTETHVVCSIHDGGQGIAPEDYSKLFTKFCRLAARPTGDEHCTGLGLYITKRLTEILHGEIWCESETKGAKFSVQFPKVVEIG